MTPLPLPATALTLASSATLALSAAPPLALIPAPPPAFALSLPPRAAVAPPSTLTSAPALAYAHAPTPATALRSVPTPAPRPPGLWPLDPRPEVVRDFDLPPESWLPGHRGLDLRGSPGQPVRAAAAGVITYAGPLAGRGVVVITHGMTRSTYEPVVSSLTRGRRVQAGELIGRLSNAGSHCAPATCLHWGLLEGTRYLDPRTLLPYRPVRLLPL